MSRKEWYEDCVYCMSKEDFEEFFGCEPADIQAFDYDFNKVHWNMNLEYGYNEYVMSYYESV